MVDVQLGAGRALDLGQRVLNQRQRAEAEEVHLQEADALDLLHRPLRDDFVAAALVERRVVGDRARRDDDAGGVRRGMPRHAFEAARDVEQLLDLRVAVLQLLEGRRLLHGLLERHVERRRNQLGDLVGIGQRDVERARDVAHGSLGLHRPEGDDLRDVLAAVAPRHVLDDLAAAPLAEVDVDIGQRHALGIQEALEDEVVLERVDVGDAKAVRDQASGGRPAARAHRNPLLAGVPDEVPDDQEVPGYRIRRIISTSYESRCSYSSMVWRSDPAEASVRRRSSRSANPSRTMCSK